MRFPLIFAIILSILIPCHIFSSENTISKITMDMNLDRNIFKTGGINRAVLKLSVKSEGEMKSRLPLNLVILIDKSGSMEGAKIQMACKAAIYAAKTLEKRDIISVVTYGNSVEAVIPAGRQIEEKNISKINNIKSSGNTALFSGLSRAIFEIRKNLSKKYINRIIVISDGFANIGLKGVEDYERLGASLKKEGISVSTIGIGTEYNEDLMVAISKYSAGNSYFVENPDLILKSFKGEIGQLLNIVARDIRVRIDLSKGIRPIRIVGREGRIKNGTISLNMNYLSENQNKFVLVELIIPSKARNKDIVVAKASVNFDDPVNLKIRSLEGLIKASYTNRQSLAKEVQNIDVKKSYLKNLNAISTEKVLKLFDQGKKAEAVKVMEQTSEKLSKAAEEIGDKDVKKEVMELDESIIEVKKKGKLSRKKRKAIKLKSFETMTQQAK